MFKFNIEAISEECATHESSTEVSTESFLLRITAEARHKLYLSRITKSGFPNLIIRIFSSICVGFLFSQS